VGNNRRTFLFLYVQCYFYKSIELSLLNKIQILKERLLLENEREKYLFRI